MKVGIIWRIPVFKRFQFQPVLEVPADVNGQGRLKYAWQKNIGNLVAVTGYRT